MLLLASLSWTHAAEETPVEKKPKPAPWKKDVDLGFTLTQGNSDTVLVNARVQAQKKWSIHRVELGARGSYGENDSQRTQASARAHGQYDRDLTNNWYAYGRADFYHDSIASVDYEATVGPGGGYYFIRNEKTELESGMNPSFQYRKKKSDPEFIVGMRAFEELSYKLNKRVRIWQNVEILPNVEEMEDFVCHAEIGVESKLTEKLKLRSSLQNRFDNLPAPNRKQNDLKLITALAYTF